MGKKYEVNINLDSIFKHAYIGLNRAYAFAGIILAEANNLEINQYHFANSGKLEFGSIDTKELEGEFVLWTKNNCLRELIECLEHTLCELYQILYAYQVTNDVYEFNRRQKELFDNGGYKNFKKKVPFEGKLQKINQLLAPKDINAELEFFTSIQNLRNSISHYMGLIHLDKVTIKLPKFGVRCLNLDNQYVTFPAGAPIDTYQLQRDENNVLWMEIIEDWEEVVLNKGQKIAFDTDQLVRIFLESDRHLKAIESKVIEFFKSTGSFINGVKEPIKQ